MTDPGPGREIEDTAGDLSLTLTPARRERGETRKGEKRKRKIADGKEVEPEVEAEVDREDETVT